jgi:O-antigen/teichoic acid export membrane protein
MERSRNKQLLLNLSTNALSYALGLAVSFLLTPYIVQKLGTAAYGYIGLSNNIISYATILSIALNSMSNRFVTIHYHRREFDDANKYLSSTFYADMVFALFLAVSLIVLTFFLERIIQIPVNLLTDVKTLFLLLVVNTSLGLSMGVFGVSTFIKNKMDYSNIRSMIGTLLRCGLLLVLFILFRPKLWYFGVTAVVMTVYITSTNLHFYKTLTPELKIQIAYFDFRRVWELIKAGIWNLVSSLSTLLNEGFDLLLANLFIGAEYMGLLSITKTVPNLVLSFVISIVASFNPEYIKLYAEHKIEELKEALLKACRILCFASYIPMSIIFAYGDIFYKCWLPTEDAHLLYVLSCIGIIHLVFALPFQSLWYVFTISNKLKKTSLNALGNSALTFLVVIGGMFLCHTNIQRLFILVGARSIFSSFRILTFLPLYASKVLNLPRYTFYSPIVKNVVCTFLLTTCSVVFKNIIHLQLGWRLFFTCCVFTIAIGLFMGCYIILKKKDRIYVLTMLKKKLKIYS